MVALALTAEDRAKWLQKAKTWSNVGGLLCTPVRPNVWALERPFTWLGIDVGSKATVVRLSDGSLWVHSPIELDAHTKAAVDELGPVKFIVTPNYEHMKFAKQWIDAYPSATSYVCPGGKDKFPSIPYDQEIANQPPPEWLGEIESCWFDCEEVPTNKKPFFNEVVFFHKTSKTLVVCDVFWNWPSANVPPGTRFFKFLMDKPYLAAYNSILARRKDLERDAGRVLAWDFDAILPCHGRVIGQNVECPEVVADDEQLARCGGDLKKLLRDHWNLS